MYYHTTQTKHPIPYISRIVQSWKRVAQYEPPYLLRVAPSAVLKTDRSLASTEDTTSKGSTTIAELACSEVRTNTFPFFFPDAATVNYRPKGFPHLHVNNLSKA